MATRNKPDTTSVVDQTTTPATSTTAQQATAPSYLKSALRLSSGFPLGAKRQDSDIHTINGNSVTDVTRVGGICVIHYMPTYGVSKDAMSALNRASFHEFNAIRSQISGNRPYETVDHMIYRAAIDSLRDLYAYASRIYSVLSTYNGLNLYRPAAIFEAMGLDYSAWRLEAATLWQWLQNNANALAPFPTVPIGNITARHRAFNSCFYTDGDLSRAQTYIFNQVGFYSYEKVDEVKGLTLEPYPTTPTEFYALWNKMYAALQNSSDVYVIAADIRRAFADKAITALTPPAFNAEVEYLKFDQALKAITNATTVGCGEYNDNIFSIFGMLSNMRIEDGGNGMIKCEPSWTVRLEQGPGAETTNVILPGKLNHINLMEETPSETDILLATRFKPVVNAKTTITADIDTIITCTGSIEAMGTEVVIALDYCVLNDQGTLDHYMLGTLNVHGRSANSLETVMKTQSARSVFDWCPACVFALINESGNVVEAVTNEDVQNYIPLSDEVLTQIIDASLLAEFGIPD